MYKVVSCPTMISGVLFEFVWTINEYFDEQNNCMVQRLTNIVIFGCRKLCVKNVPNLKLCFLQTIMKMCFLHIPIVL